MNKDNAHLYLPLVQALAEGKTIEINTNTDEQPCWKEAPGPTWCLPPTDYRIRPQPFQPLPPGEEWSNPDNLTPEQVEVDKGFRLLTKREIKIPFYGSWSYDIHKWEGRTWSRSGWCADSVKYTYRVPVSSFPLPVERKKVPLSFSDIVPGCAIRRKEIDGWLLVYSANNNGVRHQDIGAGITFTYFQSLAHCGWEYSNDHGQTWQPCEKEEASV
jgi:hypothetical protein